MDSDLFQHLFESIFKKTNDPIVLEKLKRVNINWKKPIDEILETTDVWKSACLNEIPSEPMTSMITRLFPMVHFENYHQLNDLILWRSLYISYRKSMILSELQPLIQVNYDFSELLSPHDYILSFASCDKYSAVGSNNGTIYVFDINQLNEIVFTVNFNHLIQDIKFWYSDTGDLFLVAIISPHHIKFWNLVRMVEVPCIGNGFGSHICSGTINRLFIMNYGRLYEYKHTDNGITSYLTKCISLDPASTIYLFSENNKIIIAADDQQYAVTLYSLNYRFSTSDNQRNYSVENMWISYSNDKPYTGFYYSWPVFFFLTSNVILRIMKERKTSLIYNDPQAGWKKFYPFENFGSENFVTSGILHGKVFILGFESGHVRIFTVENIELLKESNLNLHSGIEYHVADKSIQWLELLETQEKLVIIAITNHKVYSINFFPSSTRIKKVTCDVL